MAVQSFVKKVPVFEAAKWSTDNAEKIEISDWLAANEWPMLSSEQLEMEPAPSRPQGHAFDETDGLIIQWPEDIKTVTVGEWIVMNRRYHDLEFFNDETFNYDYDQYGS